MAKPDVIIFIPTENERQWVADGLAGADFDKFQARLVVSGLGRDSAQARVAETMAPIMAVRHKPLLLIGTGGCRPLDGLDPGEALASDSVTITRSMEQKTLTSTAPLVKAVIGRLTLKGFRAGPIVETADMPAVGTEAAGLALAAADFTPEPAWLNLLVARDEAAAASEDYLEALSLKLLVALSTIDQTPPPSACSSCRNPCGFPA